MKRLYSILLAFCFAISASAETVFTFSSSEDLSQTKDGVSISFAKGSGTDAPQYKVSWNEEFLPSDMRLYLGNTITISSTTNLTNIQMVFAKSCASNKEYAGLSASSGTLTSGGIAESYSDWKVDSWKGNATSVVFTLTGKGQRQIQRIVIDGEPIVISPDEPDPLPTEADLQTDYTYAEPTTVYPKDTTIIGNAEYAFIDNNILIYCNEGSILKEDLLDEDDPHPAYFNCHANHSITFTATENIKGIEIDGFVRKAFNATCDPETATIEYLTDSDYDMEGWPALVIRNINAKSVTLTCPKQLRCYAVRLFFQENPDPLYTGIGSMPDSEISIQKILREGRLLIIRGEKIYSAQGMEEK